MSVRTTRLATIVFSVALPAGAFACDALLGLDDPIPAAGDGGADAPTDAPREAGDAARDAGDAAPCPPGLCSAVALGVIPGASSLAVDDAYVYVSWGRDPPDSSTSVTGVTRFPIDGPFDAGVERFRAQGFFYVSDIATDGMHLYVASNGTDDVSDLDAVAHGAALYSIPEDQDDADAAVLASGFGSPVYLTIQPDGLYFFDVNFDDFYRGLYRVTADGGVDRLAPSGNLYAVSPIENAGTGVYFANEAGVGVAVPGTSPTILVPEPARSIVSAGGRLFWSGPGVRTAALDGYDATTIAPPSLGARYLIARDATVYVVTESALVSLSGDGGVETLSDTPPYNPTGFGDIHRIAVTARGIYWLDANDVLRYRAR